MSARALTLAFSLFALAAAGTARAATTASAAAKEAAGAKEELRDLKSRIEAVQKRLAETEETKSEAADALRQSERAISDATRALAQLTEQSRSANSKLAELKREIERAQAQVSSEQSALAKLLYQRYVAGRPETLGIMLNGGDPNAIAREFHYLTYIGRARSETIARVRAGLARLDRLAAEAESEATQIASVAREQAQQRRRLEDEKRARAQVLARISRDVEKHRREIGTMKRDEARLTTLIEQLSRAIARAPRPRAPAESKAPPPQARVKIERVPEPGGPAGSFAQLRGHLALPVRGELANRFGTPRQDGGVVWKGLFIAAKPGEEVRAIAAGRVVYADWLRGFGNLLIIDHGDSYMSLYGYNETLYKQVGDSIRGGERIAAVGNTGGHPDSGLYFEMRHEGRPFDPLAWVSVR